VVPTAYQLATSVWVLMMGLLTSSLWNSEKRWLSHGDTQVCLGFVTGAALLIRMVVLRLGENSVGLTFFSPFLVGLESKDIKPKVDCERKLWILVLNCLLIESAFLGLLFFGFHLCMKKLPMTLGDVNSLSLPV